jgi:S1-C subfamily serine protease
MALPAHPLDVIFPIVVRSLGHQAYRFIGTGFFVSPDGLFVTARHVLRDNPLQDSEQYEVVLLGHGRSQLKAIRVVETSESPTE